MHEQHQAGLGERCDRLEIVGERVFEILGQAFVDRAAEQRHVQRVAVGLGPRHRFKRDVAGRAGAILDIDLLAESLAELRSDHARDDIARPARGKPDHQADRLARVGRLRRYDTWDPGEEPDHGRGRGNSENAEGARRGPANLGSSLPHP